jgi:hypothetical protein
MKLPEVIQQLLGLERRIETLEGKPNGDTKLFEALLRQQQAKKRHDPAEPPSWFDPQLRD